MDKRVKFDTVEEYFEQVSDQRLNEAAADLRRTLLQLLPDAVETISYDLPTVKVKGAFFCYGIFKNHCSFFPGAIIESFADELKPFKTSKGTIQFTPENPLPKDLVVRIVQARLLEAEMKQRKKKQPKANES